MWNRKRKEVADTSPVEQNQLPFIDATIREVREAVRKFADEAPAGVYSSVLVTEDNTIDYNLLKPYLHGKPEKTFYMSRSTYEIFDESEKEICIYTDKVQAAVDAYYKETGELPLIEGDPYRKVSYYKLASLQLLPERPTIDFYITHEEYLITHRRPK